MTVAKARRSGIYAIIFIPTGRAYVGQAEDTPKRWREHKCALRAGRHKSLHLQSAWDKYGESSFEFTVLEKILREDLTLDEFKGVLTYQEQYWMDRHENLFNHAPAAGSSLGIKMSEKFREGCRIRRLGVPLTEEHKKKIGDSLRGIPKSEEARVNSANGQRGTVKSETTRERISKAKRYFNDDQIEDIARRYSAGESQLSISNDFAVHPSTVSRVITRYRAQQ